MQLSHLYNYSLPLLGWFYPNYRRKSKFMIISYIGIHWPERKSKTHNHNQPSLGNTHCFFPNTNVFVGKIHRLPAPSRLWMSPGMT